MELVNFVMQYAVVPLAAFLGVLHNSQQAQKIELEGVKKDVLFLSKTIDLTKESHDREMSEIRTTTRAILDKLTSFEEYLRK